MEMDIDLKDLTDEQYVVKRAKMEQKLDPFSAKAWMITAKTLYPHNFSVQFEAYRMEKEAGHVKEAAKYFSDLLEKFQQEPEFWTEIENVTIALRTETDAMDSKKQFLCEMFKHISLEMQHQLLLFTADHCEDTMEHCRLLLLLLQRFPAAIKTHGSRLVETLLSAEKHSHIGNQPLNPYRRLLVCDLLPLLGSESSAVEFSSKLLFKILHKSTEFFMCYLDIVKSGGGQEFNLIIDDPWRKLFNILDLVGKHLGWDAYLTNLGNSFTKESYWQKLSNFYKLSRISLNVEGSGCTKQLLYCITIFLLYSLYDYNLSLSPTSTPAQIQTPLILVEGFVDSKLPNPLLDLNSKRRKDDTVIPHLTIDKCENRNVIGNFLMAVNCWDLLHSSDNLQREFSKLNVHFKLDSWLSNFLVDFAIYKGLYDDALVRLQQTNIPLLSLTSYIRQANILYLQHNFTGSFEHIVLAVQSIPMANRGGLSTQLVIGGTQRHLHFLSLNRLSVLQYCIKLLMRCIKESSELKHTNSPDLAIGNMMVLLQFDWPQEEDILPSLMEQIQQRGAFSYLLFQMYLINSDILEELTYLWSEQGSQITLDILPHLGQRRIGTRGADKGVKEEIRHAMKRQITRTSEAMDVLMIKFIIQERGHILQSLVS